MAKEEENTIDVSGILAPQKPYGAGYDTNKAGVPTVTQTAPQIERGGRSLAGGMHTWEALAIPLESLTNSMFIGVICQRKRNANSRRNSRNYLLPLRRPVSLAGL